MVAAIALILILEESTDGEEELGIVVVGCNGIYNIYVHYEYE